MSLGKLINDHISEMKEIASKIEEAEKLTDSEERRSKLRDLELELGKLPAVNDSRIVRILREADEIAKVYNVSLVAALMATLISSMRHQQS